MNGKSIFKEIFRSLSPLCPTSPINAIINSNRRSNCALYSTLAPVKNISSFHPSLLPLETHRTIKELFQIQAHLITSGFFQDPLNAGKVLQTCSDLGFVDYTILIFRNIESPDALCVNTVIKAYSRSTDPNQAVVFYFDMLQNGFLPNSFTFPPLFNSCAKIDSAQPGAKCHAQAIKNCVHNVLPVQNSMIDMYANFGLMDSAWRLFNDMSERDTVSWNSIISGYVKLDNLATAHRIFNRMPTKNVVSWNIMISGYLEIGNPGCGLKLFREMQKSGLRGSAITMVSVLTACGRSARLKEGKSVHGSIIRNFMESSLILDTSLIDMYSKCKIDKAARRVFDRMPGRNLVCWNAMILGHCIHGCPEDGIILFKDMVEKVEVESSETRHSKTKKSQVEKYVFLPDEITFIGVLCACARAGLLSEGQKYFIQMTNLYGIKPKFAHYWCMANLYFDVGLVQEAEEFLRRMLNENTDWLFESSLWSGFFGSCRFQGDIDLGEKIALQLIEMDTQNALGYSLLSNIYGAAGRWNDVEKVKEMAKEKGVRTPGCHLIDLNRIVHHFRIGESSQPGVQEVYHMMDKLSHRLKLPMNDSFPP
ncbi:hypothetical protein Syun_010500 [Stephania yunnanensis]|uniref:Pentatricopeptide repeat-containing protein n=1 Tax=Stephania yunnanensis TaxID=152371 RepID=A0AAP0KGM3_9MAGN